MLGRHWYPPANMWTEMNRLKNEMEQLFGRAGEGSRGDGRGAHPGFNLWEDDDNLFVEAELPGIELDDIDIVVTGDRHLSLKGERKQPALEGGAWHRQERGFGNFARSVELPHDVDSENVSANLTYGVLTITLPKREEAKPRKIKVKAS